MVSASPPGFEPAFGNLDLPALAEQAVHVVKVDADQPPLDPDTLRLCLNAEETARATRFRQLQHQQRWIVARGLLRTLLGRYLGCNPAAIEFHYGPSGKPHLLSDQSEPVLLHFNLSHSGNCILLAFARMPVGVDVESLRPGIDPLALAKRWFQEQEYRKLQSLPTALQNEAFTAIWTRKEALLKARGEGIAKALGSIEVSVDPHAPAEIVAPTDSVSAWGLMDLEISGQYRAAMAATGKGWQTQCIDWQPAI